MVTSFVGVYLTINCSWLIGFSVVSGFDLRFSGGVPRQQLQPHDLFVSGEVVNQVDQANRPRVAPSPNVAQVKSFHGLAHETEDLFDPRPNLRLLPVAVFLFIGQRAVAIRPLMDAAGHW